MLTCLHTFNFVRSSLICQLSWASQVGLAVLFKLEVKIFRKSNQIDYVHNNNVTRTWDLEKHSILPYVHQQTMMIDLDDGIKKKRHVAAFRIHSATQLNRKFILLWWWLVGNDPRTCSCDDDVTHFVFYISNQVVKWKLCRALLENEMRVAVMTTTMLMISWCYETQLTGVSDSFSLLCWW